MTMDPGQSTAVSETIEGLDDTAVSVGAVYPLDDVMVRTETRTAREVVERIRKNRVIMDPEFQREFVWPVDKQSKLIESCIMRLPLPVFYLAEARDGRIIVVDGLQRLTTLKNFFENKFILKGLTRGRAEEDAQHFLEGKSYETLDLRLRERVEDTQLTLYILDSNAPELARLDIFERVNSGVPLSRQQMRNALYTGPATRWLREQVESGEFKAVNSGSLDHKSMRDRESINRFAGFFLLGVDGYGRGEMGEMDAFLAHALESMNRLGPEALDDLSIRFRWSMTWHRRLFGRHAFRKSLAADDPGVPRTPLNISLFDVLSVGFARISEAILTKKEQKIKARTIGLVQDSNFNESISFSTSNSSKVKCRFEKMEEFFWEFFDE